MKEDKKDKPTKWDNGEIVLGPIENLDDDNKYVYAEDMNGNIKRIYKGIMSARRKWYEYRPNLSKKYIDIGIWTALKNGKTFQKLRWFYFDENTPNDKKAIIEKAIGEAVKSAEMPNRDFYDKKFQDMPVIADTDELKKKYPNAANDPQVLAEIERIKAQQGTSDPKLAKDPRIQSILKKLQK
jgi:hypothetical protein